MNALAERKTNQGTLHSSDICSLNKMTSTKRQQRAFAPPVIAVTAIRPPAIQQSNFCCLWEHQFMICFSGCNLIVKASELKQGTWQTCLGEEDFHCANH